MFEFFKNRKIKKQAVSELIRKDLKPQADLIKSSSNFVKFNEKRFELEIKFLRVQKVDFSAALRSQTRFTDAKEICIKYSLTEEASFLQNYIDLYKKYAVDLVEKAKASGGGSI